MPLLGRSAAEGWGGARRLRGQTDRIGVHLVGGLGFLVEAAVLVANEHIDRTINTCIGAYDRLLEERLDELPLGIVHVGADDDGLLDLLNRVGGQRDAEPLGPYRSAGVRRQALALARLGPLD